MDKITNIFYGVLGRINNKYGKVFLYIQGLLFTILIANVVIEAVPQLLTKQVTSSYFISNLFQLLLYWIIASIIITVCWTIFIANNLDLWIYYFILIPVLVKSPILLKAWCYIFYRKNRDKIARRLKDIEASRESHSEGYDLPKFGKNVRYPSFIMREHLERKSFWPHWVFSIVAIFNENSLHTVVENKKGKKHWTLAVDLRDESFGIYSTRGKRFLSSRFDASIRNYKELSVQTQKLFSPDAPVGSSPVIQGTTIPMRWASGGYLPVIFYKNKYWVSLFFRDIPPIGLNVANGATENKDEYKSLNRLISREFSEETILLSAKPSKNCEMTQVIFETVLPSTKGPTQEEYRAVDFVGMHAKLREVHDGFQIDIPDEDEENSDRRRLFPIDTPFTVTVRYHLPDLRRHKQNKIEFIVPSINPRETGIETIWLCTFEMKDNEYLIDGEYDLARNYLIRQPVILLEMGYLSQIYKRTKSLGEMVISEKGFDDVKRIPPVPKGSYCLFDIDVDFRKSRLAHLKSIDAKNDGGRAVMIEYKMSHQRSQDALIKELTRIETWLSDYENAFKSARNGQLLDDPRLRSFCPVTWKTLELIFAHQLDYRKFD